jgi:tripartite-type tricarboxylate transporter receptor subunit TctC
MRTMRCDCLIALAVLLAGVAQVQAQYPTRPIRIVVTVAPGGAADTVARVVAQSLAEALGKPVVVDNRPGGGGNIGAELVARAPPDGYTLLLGSTFQAIAPSLYGKLNYDLLRDFVPVSLLASSPLMIAVHPSVAAKSVAELIALAKAKPNQLAFASAGTGGGNHLAAVLFCEMAGIQMSHVPFKGAAPALIAVIAGEVPVTFATFAAVVPHLKTGKLRALGMTSAQRSPVAPDVPTVSEAGLPGYESVNWYGLNAPSGTPKEVVSRLHAEAAKSLQLPEVRERFAAISVEPIGSTPEHYGAYLRSEIEKWGRVVRASGARPD